MREACWASAAVLAVLTIVKHTSQAIPDWSGYIIVLATAFQMYWPLWRVGHNHVSRNSLGLTSPRWGRLLGYLGFTSLLIGSLYASITHYMMLQAGRSWTGTLPPGGLELIITELIVIAGPEELYFRGYLQERFIRAFGSRPTALAIAASSGVFALAHFVGEYNPYRLLTFFPSLVFGALHVRTGSLITPVLFHAFCNLLALALHHGYRVA